MLGCACSLTDLSNMKDTRIIQPASWDCTLGRINYKRGRKEQMVWSENSRNRRRSLPRKCLTGRRRRPSQNGDQSTLPRGEEDSSVQQKGEVHPLAQLVQQEPRGDGDMVNQIPSSEVFGGSGAKFASLRNRRGVREGGDGRFQTKLFLSISNDGNGRFSLITGEGVTKAGKRPADDNQEIPSGKKLKVQSVL